MSTRSRYYPPRAPLDGVTLHVLRHAAARRATTTPRCGARVRVAAVSRAASCASRTALRYRRSRASAASSARSHPDVFHAHFLVEHGFYGALAGFHPYVVTAWGSDVLVEPQRDRISRLIATWTLAPRRSGHIEQRLHGRTHRVALGRAAIEGRCRHARRRSLLPRSAQSSRLTSGRRTGSRAGRAQHARARAAVQHRRVLDAYESRRARSARRAPRRRARRIADAGIVAAQASASSGRIEFVGFVDRERLRATRCRTPRCSSLSHLPMGPRSRCCRRWPRAASRSSADLPTQRELDRGRRQRLPRAASTARTSSPIASAQALATTRFAAAPPCANAAIVEARGLNEHEMAKMESALPSLASTPRGGR